MAEARARTRAGADQAPDRLPPVDPSKVPPADEEHPTTIWVCENSKCRYYGVKRRVRWQHLGAGLYLVGTIRCLCGHLPVKEPTGLSGRGR